MAGTTPNLALYLPGGGSTGTYTPDEVADIDPINQNFVKLDTFAGQVGVQTNQNKQFYGPAAAIAAITGMKLGDEYQESDANKVRWRYDGLNWITSENGMWLIRPTTVVNGVILPSGHVQPSGAADNMRVDGIFSARFKRYMVMTRLYAAGGANGLNFRLVAGTTPDATANYHYQGTTMSTATVATGVTSPATQWAATGMAAQEHLIQTLIADPADAAQRTLFKSESAEYNSGLGTSLAGGGHNVLAAYDGLYYILSTTGAGRFLAITSDFAFYGMA